MAGSWPPGGRPPAPAPPWTGHPFDDHYKCPKNIHDPKTPLVSEHLPMKRVGSKNIDFRTWTLLGDEEAKKLVGVVEDHFKAALTDLLQQIFDDDPPSLYFPFKYGIGEDPNDGLNGPPVADPATVYVSVPLGAHSDERCYYGISLEAAVDDIIESHVSWRDGHRGKIHGAEEQAMCRKIAARLRELAAKLEDACATEEE
jgi:hypothetical protein